MNDHLLRLWASDPICLPESKKAASINIANDIVKKLMPALAGVTCSN